MKINEIKIMQRRNLGNYEHREVTLSAVIDEGDCLKAATSTLNNEVMLALGYKKDEKVEVEEVKEEEEPKEPVKKKRAAPRKKKEVVKEPEVIPSPQEMMDLCRETATRLASGDKVKALILEACGVSSLKEADADTYLPLKKLLTDAK